MNGPAVKRVAFTFTVAGLFAGTQMIAPPAQASTKWGPSQEVSSRVGRALNVSDDGTVAAWIRTNQYSSGAGPVRTSYYKSSKKGWTSSAEVPGTVGARQLAMSGDGNCLLADVPGTGFVMSQRASKNSWGVPQTIAGGQFLRIGALSADGKTVMYGSFTAEFPSPPVPGNLNVITRNADGSWTAPTVVGTLNDSAYPASGFEYAAMSRDGSTIAWVDDTWALQARTRLPDGTWSAPVLLKQFTESPTLNELVLSADGTRVAWSYQWDTDGIVTATRSGSTWTPLSTVTADAVDSFAVSPNGNVVAYTSEDNDQLLLRSWTGTKWSKVKVMGSVKSYYADIALTNKTLAWTYKIGGELRASIYAKSKWQPSVKLASTAVGPALNSNGRTVLWASTNSKKLYSKKR